MIIDMHAHIVPENFPVKESRPSGGSWPIMERVDSGQADMMIAGKKFRTFRDTAWDSAKRVDDLPSIGVDKQLLTPLPELLMYNLDPADGAELATHLNETIAGMVDANPEHYYGMGTVPLQDVELAIAELGRIKELGLLGVEIRSNVEGSNLGEQRFRSFFREAASLDLAIFVHAYRSTLADRLEHLPGPVWDSHVGYPIECGLAGVSLIWSGLLAEIPELRVCMSHGGGVLTQLLARSDTMHRSRKGFAELLPEPPMDYARRLYYDDLAWNVPTLRYLVDSMGASQVTVGTDYSGASARTMTTDEEFDALGLSAAEREAISHGNAERFLGIS